MFSFYQSNHSTDGLSIMLHSSENSSYKGESTTLQICALIQSFGLLFKLQV